MPLTCGNRPSNLGTSETPFSSAACSCRPLTSSTHISSIMGSIATRSRKRKRPGGKSRSDRTVPELSSAMSEWEWLRMRSHSQLPQLVSPVRMRENLVSRGTATSPMTFCMDMASLSKCLSTILSMALMVLKLSLVTSILSHSITEPPRNRGMTTCPPFLSDGSRPDCSRDPHSDVHWFHECLWPRWQHGVSSASLSSGSRLWSNASPTLGLSSSCVVSSLVGRGLMTIRVSSRKSVPLLATTVLPMSVTP
mmetsp:Transcript_16077/g.38394  ORF Transcript_16077/g.38394 Transcript_16077/m.38394 type:complete len:251 (+) Transcript_16077:1011-1763(+)